MFIDIIVMFDEIVVLRVHGDVTGDGGDFSWNLNLTSLTLFFYFDRLLSVGT